MKLALRLAAVAVIAALAWLATSRFWGAEIDCPVPPDSDSSANGSETSRSDLQAPLGRENGEAEPEVVQGPPEARPRAEARRATGLLRVHLVSPELRRPLAGLRVEARAKGDKSMRSSDAGSSHAGLGQLATTDAEGRAELEVEPGRELALEVIDRSKDPPLLVAALSAGERREVEMKHRVGTGIALIGRLVDAATGEAISDAKLRLEAESYGSSGHFHAASGSSNEPRLDMLRPDSGGYFEVQACSWEKESVKVEASGYARAGFAIEKGHETLESALEVRLVRGATLAVRVLDGEHAAQDATIVVAADSMGLRLSRLTSDFYSDPDFDSDHATWSAVADASGLAEITDLPANVPFELFVTPAGRERRKQGEAITLLPGERRSLEVRLDPGATITGRIADGAGVPVAGCTIWRVWTDRGTTEELLDRFPEPAAVATADDEGRFRFDDVPAGNWLIGAAPGWSEIVGTHSPDAFASLAQGVRVEPGSDRFAVALLVERGLYLRGTVLDPDGAAATDARVSAIRARSNVLEQSMVMIDVETDEAGRFTLGPMPSGTYWLDAGEFASDFAPSERMRVTAGDSGLVLRLQAAGKLRVLVVDSSGVRGECPVLLMAESGHGRYGTRSAHDGTLLFDGLRPGRYSLRASTSDGRIGWRSGLVIGAGATLDVVKLALDRGASLRVRTESEPQGGTLEVFVDGASFDERIAPTARSETIAVPAGEIELRWRDEQGLVLHTEKFTVSAGQEHEVVWGGK